MKKWFWDVLFWGLGVVAIGTLMGMVIRLHADAVPGPNVVSIAVATAGACPTPVFTGSNSVTVLCGAPDALYVSTVQHPTPTPVNLGAVSVPVSSVFGRTGNIAAASGDYSFSQISGTAALTQLPSLSFSNLGGSLAATQMPTSQTCTFTGTISASGPSTLTISACH